MQLFCCRVACSSHDFCNGWLCKWDDCKKVLSVWWIWIIWVFVLLFLYHSNLSFFVLAMWVSCVCVSYFLLRFVLVCNSHYHFSPNRIGRMCHIFSVCVCVCVCGRACMCVFCSKKMVDGKEVYEYNGKYWEARKDPGFSKMTFVRIYWVCWQGPKLTTMLVSPVWRTSFSLEEHKIPSWLTSCSGEELKVWYWLTSCNAEEHKILFWLSSCSLEEGKVWRLISCSAEELEVWSWLTSCSGEEHKVWSWLTSCSGEEHKVWSWLTSCSGEEHKVWSWLTSWCDLYISIEVGKNWVWSLYTSCSEEEHIVVYRVSCSEFYYGWTGISRSVSSLSECIVMMDLLPEFFQWICFIDVWQWQIINSRSWSGCDSELKEVWGSQDRKFPCTCKAPSHVMSNKAVLSCHHRRRVLFSLNISTLVYNVLEGFGSVVTNVPGGRYTHKPV